MAANPTPASPMKISASPDAQLVGEEGETQSPPPASGVIPRMYASFLPSFLAQPHPQRQRDHRDHQQEDHRQRHRRLVPEDILVVVDQHGLHDRHRRGVEEPGGQQDQEGFVGEDVLQRSPHAAAFGRFHPFRFAHAEKVTSSDSAARKPKMARHADEAGGAPREQRHDGHGSASPQQRADHRESLLDAGDVGALVVVRCHFRQQGVVGDVGEGVDGAEEDVGQHGTR